MTTVREWARTVADGRPAHLVLVGTKPDIIKQVPVVRALRDAGEAVLLVHSGQHTDATYSSEMFDEFGVQPDAVLSTPGSSMHDLVATVTVRFAELLLELRAAGVAPVPYLHGDTSTAMAAAVAATSVDVGTVHVEAGLRTLSPEPAVVAEWSALAGGTLDWPAFAAQHRRDLFTTGSREPRPEQFNTRVVDAGAAVHAAPVALNADFLRGEGYDASVRVTGNTVADAVRVAERAQDRGFVDRFPQLGDGGYVRFCVHRRETTTDPRRFAVLMDALELLLERGHRVLFVRLFGTDAALRSTGREAWLAGLEQRYGERLVSTPVWGSYAQAIGALAGASVLVTDSGSMQEEANVLGVPCVTTRYGSDRAESLFGGGNVLAPPLAPGFVADVVDGAVAHLARHGWEDLYGEQPAAALVDAVLTHLRDHPDVRGLSLAEEQRYRGR